MTVAEVYEKYEQELKRIAEDQSTVVESTWRGLLGSFAFELAAADGR